MGYTIVTDVIVPEIYLAYLQLMTEVKSALVQSNAVQTDAKFNALLAGGGLTFNMPEFEDLSNADANVSSDSASDATPEAVTTTSEVAVRLSRNKSIGAADLVTALAGADPMRAMATRFAPFWARELERTVLAALKGVFADNTANDSGDMTNDISGVSFVDGVTNFTAAAVIDTLQTIGDSKNSLALVWMHSKVEATALKNNLIDYVQDSSNPGAEAIPTYLGRRVIVDDTMPNTGGVYETFFLGVNSIAWGTGTPEVPLEEYRLPLANNGGGKKAVVSRVEWVVHPRGAAYVGTPPNGGPSNASSSNNLGAAGSWDRRVSERKQMKLARLVTREE